MSLFRLAVRLYCLRLHASFQPQICDWLGGFRASYAVVVHARFKHWHFQDSLLRNWRCKRLLRCGKLALSVKKRQYWARSIDCDA